jgi:hypothetical protein
MAKLSVKEIREEAVRMLGQERDGIRFMQLVKAIQTMHPDDNPNTIFTTISELHHTLAGKVIKPSRGLFQLADAAEAEEREEFPGVIVEETERLLEQQFYPSFAEFLKNDLDEVTSAEPLGGAGLRGKWGTPDVVGVYKPRASDLIKFEKELISAEIKTDPLQPVVAFGQAVAYRLFSHKTYIAMPTTLSPKDRDHMEALCMLFGLGLVVFDLSVKNPNYSIRVRAQRFAPDMFYVNDFVDRLRKHDPEAFERLFG